jgi:thymidylate synthase (FAD)
MRATEHADVEIRRVAVECLRQLRDVAPNVFGDYEILRGSDGSEIAVSAFAAES